jgi:predicted glycoside hydrolase/deacetylase ChbG (UPF0249 family)
MRFVLVLSAVLLAAPAPASAQSSLQERLGYPKDARLLIVHADDLGMAQSVNAASLRALESRLVNSASIMVPCPWLPQIAEWAKAHPETDLGIHLTLTSEWTPFRWGPLLSRGTVPTLFDADGYLHKTETEAASRIDPKEAEAEIRAQIARARAAGIVPTHLDSHMGTLYQTRELFEVFMRVAREEKIPARISRAHAAIPYVAEVLTPSDVVIDRIISIGADVPAEKWVTWYTDQIRNLEPGVTEVILHLAYDDAEMRALSADHPNWGSAWRQRDYDFFTSERFRTLLRERGIRLITWREIGKLLAP